MHVDEGRTYKLSDALSLTKDPNPGSSCHDVTVSSTTTPSGPQLETVTQIPATGVSGFLTVISLFLCFSMSLCLTP